MEAPKPRMIKVFAPAKVNLTLHVTGQREDGYHLLDSLVCFPNIGDRLTFSPAREMSLTIHGAPDLPTDDTNLVMKAARAVLRDTPHHIELFKSLPVSSGIGGGSGNAAAVLRFAMQHIDKTSNIQDLATATKLGADVPVCITSLPQRFQGIGDVLTPVTAWPTDAYVLLVNPRVPVSTPKIFNALSQKTNPPMPGALPTFDTVEAVVDFIASQRNDLQGPAIAQQPVIEYVLKTIVATKGCLFARMSGSGATCFGIYSTQEDVLKAAAEIGSNFPNWWVEYGDLQTRQKP